MGMTQAWLWSVLAAVAVAVWPSMPVLPTADPSARQWRSAGRVTRAGPAPVTRRAILIVLATLSVTGLLVPNWFLPAMPLAILAGALSRRLPVKVSAAEQTRHRDALTTRCELLASCLEIGLPTGTALTAVLEVTGPDDEADSAGAALHSIAALVALGADSNKAWAPADSIPDLIPIAAAARRSALGGVGLAQAVREQAATLAAATVADLERRAGRAGVLMAAPLGLCFLPAFICLGLAPVIIALLASLGIA